jgi:hypothetical protein
MTASGGDHAADTFRWDILVQCGDPRIAEVGALWNPAISTDGWFDSPITAPSTLKAGCGCHRPGHGMAPRTQHADEVYAVETDSAGRGQGCSIAYLVGAQLCGRALHLTE